MCKFGADFRDEYLHQQHQSVAKLTDSLRYRQYIKLYYNMKLVLLSVGPRKLRPRPTLMCVYYMQLF